MTAKLKNPEQYKNKARPQWQAARYEADDIIELANQLTLNDMERLIWCFMDKMMPIIWEDEDTIKLDEENTKMESVRTNGHCLQLNIEVRGG